MTDLLSITETCDLGPAILIAPNPFGSEVKREDEYMILQATTRSRSQLAHTIEEGFSAFSDPEGGCSLPDMRRELRLVRSLYKKSTPPYTTICEAEFARGTPTDVSFVIRRVPLHLLFNPLTHTLPPALFRQLTDETVFASILSGLVSTDSIPNFPIIYSACRVEEKEEGRVVLDTFQEVSSGSIESILPVLDTEEYWFSILPQTLCGLMWCARVYGIVHNDLFLRNLLYNSVALNNYGKVTYAYNVWCAYDGKWHRWNVDTYGILVKLADFELGSIDASAYLSGRVAEGLGLPSHSGIVEQVGGKKQEADGGVDLETWLSWRKEGGERASHVLFLPYVKPYARDVYTVLLEVSSQPSIPRSLRLWACLALQLMYDSMRSSPLGATLFEHPEDLVDFSCAILSPEFLSAAGLDPSLLQATDTPTQTFYLPELGGTPRATTVAGNLFSGWLRGGGGAFSPCRKRATNP